MCPIILTLLLSAQRRSETIRHDLRQSLAGCISTRAMLAKEGLPMFITQPLGALMIAELICMSSIAQAADPPPRAKPEEVGLSSQRLGDIGKTVNADAGAVLAVARHGKLAYFEAFGFRDKAAGAPMTTDAIFNIASMTKPMTAVGGPAALRAGQAPDGRAAREIFSEIRGHAVGGDGRQEGEHRRRRCRRHARSRSRTCSATPTGLSYGAAAPPPSTSSIRKAAARRRPPIRERNYSIISHRCRCLPAGS